MIRTQHDLPEFPPIKGIFTHKVMTSHLSLAFPTRYSPPPLRLRGGYVLATVTQTTAPNTLAVAFETPSATPPSPTLDGTIAPTSGGGTPTPGESTRRRWRSRWTNSSPSFISTTTRKYTCGHSSYNHCYCQCCHTRNYYGSHHPSSQE